MLSYFAFFSVLMQVQHAFSDLERWLTNSYMIGYAVFFFFLSIIIAHMLVEQIIVHEQESFSNLFIYFMTYNL